MKHLLSLYLLCAFLALPVGAIAQQTELKDTLPGFLNEVTISATKTETLRKNIAQQVQLLTAKDIRFLQPQTTADLVAQTGTVSIQKSQQGGGSPVIRGFEANRILLVLDGVRMNNLIYRGGHLQNILSVDNLALERLEVLSGPASSMYGSDALGGVIVMKTSEPRFAPDTVKSQISGNVLLRYASANNENTGHLHLNAGGKKFASFSSFSFTRFDDLKGGKSKNPFYKRDYGSRLIYSDRINGIDSIRINSSPEKQIQSGYHQYDLLQKFSFSKHHSVIHQLNLQYSTTSDVPRYDRLTDPDGSGLRFAEWYYGPQQRLLGIYTLKIKRDKTWMNNLQLAASFQDIEESRHTRRFRRDQLQHRNEKVNVFALNIDISRNLNRHQLRYGAEIQHNTLKSTAHEENIFSGQTAPLDTRYPGGDNYMQNSSLYLSHDWHVNEVFTLTDGIRLGYSQLKSTFSDTSFFPFPFRDVKQTSPQFAANAGIIYHPAEKLKASLLFSSGYRVPNVDDLGKVFESGSGVLIVPNRDLGPEKTFNAELGITWQPKTSFSWENAVYYTWFRDAIITAPFQFGGQDSILYDGKMSRVFANRNNRNAFITGFNTAVRYSAGEHFRLDVTAGYTYGRIQTDSSDQPLDHIPPFMARLQITYLYKTFRADFISQYNGWKKIEDYYRNGEDNEQYATPEGMPAWIVFNLRFALEFKRNILLQAGCDNLLDTQYRVFASGINAPGRNVMVSLRITY